MLVHHLFALLRHLYFNKDINPTPPPR